MSKCDISNYLCGKTVEYFKGKGFVDTIWMIVKMVWSLKYFMSVLSLHIYFWFEKDIAILNKYIFFHNWVY